MRQLKYKSTKTIMLINCSFILFVSILQVLEDLWSSLWFIAVIFIIDVITVIFVIWQFSQGEREQNNRDNDLKSRIDGGYSIEDLESLTKHTDEDDIQTRAW